MSRWKLCAVADGVDFIDEKQRRSVFLCCVESFVHGFKQIAEVAIFKTLPLCNRGRLKMHIAVGSKRRREAGLPGARWSEKQASFVDFRPRKASLPPLIQIVFQCFGPNAGL